MNQHRFSDIWDVLTYIPEPKPGDPKWKPWFCQTGDTVEIYNTKTKEHLGEYNVIAATSTEFKLQDGRIFDQRGWGILNKSKSPIRAKKLWKFDDDDN